MFLANAMPIPSENIYYTKIKSYNFRNNIFSTFSNLIIARKNATFFKATMSFLHNNYYMHIRHDNHSFFAQLVWSPCTIFFVHVITYIV